MHEIKKYTQANRLAWNEAMPHHQEANKSKWDDRFSRAGYSVIQSPELELLEQIDLSGKAVAHLCCNNGVELMSLKNMGAGKCVGFDISDEAISEANERAQRFGIDCEFIQSDVYDIAPRYNNEFDLIYISIGCLGWLPDLPGFMGRVQSLLKTRGQLFIYEEHPFAEMLPSDDMVDMDPQRIIEPYFKDEPYVETDGIDYVGKKAYASKPMYWFVWTLSDILMGVIEHGMQLKHFSEYPEDISTLHSRNQTEGPAIPLSYILIAEKG